MNERKRFGRKLMGLLLFLCGTVAGAQTAPPQEWTPATAARVDALVAAYVPAVLPGLQLAVAYRGRLLYAQGYGLADVRQNIAMRADTPMRIGSVTKQITAAAILLLARQKKLSLDDPLSRWVPEVRLAHEPNLRQLVQMVGGIRGDDDELFGGAVAEIEEPPLPPARFLANVAAQGRFAAPGDAYAYSNAGYTLLGVVIERATGEPLETVYRRLFFEPAQMHSATLVSATPRPGDAVGHFRPRTTDPWRQCPDLNSGFGAAGGLIMTAQDLVRWNRLLLGGALLPAADIEAMRTPARLNNGESAPIGMGIASLGPSVGWGAAGQTVNFAAFNAVYASGYEVVLLANGSNEQRDAAYPRMRLAAQIHNAVHPSAPVPLPDAPAAEPGEPAAMQLLLARCR